MAMPSRRERLEQFAATVNPRKVIRAPVLLSDLWAKVEGTGRVLSVVLGKLETPRDIGNAAAVSRIWCAAATNDGAWESACRSFSLLCLVKEENWCVDKSFKAILKQHHAAQCMMKQAPTDHCTCQLSVCGPHLQQDYFSVRSLKDYAPGGKLKHVCIIPAGSARATRAQVEHNGILQKISTNGQVCLLSDGDALFPSGTALGPAVFKEHLHEFDAQRLGSEALRRPIEHELLFSDMPESKLRVLETLTIRREFLLGIEVRDGCGTVLFSKLADLIHLRSGLDASVLYTTRQSAPWPGRANAPPRVSLFILRKGDGSRLDLVVDSACSYTCEGDYDSEIMFRSRFGIEGTGRYGGLFNLLRLQVCCSKRGQCLCSLRVELEPCDALVADLYDDWVVQSVEWMLHILSSPGFVRRWVAPPRERRVRKQADTSLRALGHVHDLLRTAVVNSTKPPPLMSLVLQHLEVKVMVCTGVVCHDWYVAVNHPETWSRVLQMHPMLAQIREHSDVKLPCSSTKCLFIQQYKSRRAASAQLVRPPRPDYCLAVEIVDDGEHVHSSLTDITLADPKMDLLAENHFENLVTVTFSQGETVTFPGDSETRLSFSLFRKRDGKRFPLHDDCVKDVGANVLFFYGTLPAVFTIYDDSKDYSSVPIITFDADLHLEQPDPEDTSDSAILKSVDINIDTACEDMFSMCSVDGMIQLLECPGFVHLWT